MGNYLVGIAPSEIYPVEHYLTDHKDLRFDVSLGSTRFFKVARAKSQEGLIVVKVFVIHDPTLLLLPHKEKIEEIRSKLASAVNCLPFQKAIVGEKACFIMREYVKYSLYDRISTKPFLSNLEKKWITFQALYAVHQAHKYGVCHGDIKTENIMITSWNWVLLTDFASFKPTYVAKDTPADFSYFFDMSRRGACYLAPERFVRTITCGANNALFPEQDLKIGDLHPMMDIFSLGCALIELYNEGRPPFDFPELLAFRKDEYSPQPFLDRIEDRGIREMLASMIEKDPANRKSAEIYLSQARGSVFPEYFYGFLQSYMQIFSAPPLLTPDEKISRLKKDIDSIVGLFKSESSNADASNTCDEVANISEPAQPESAQVATIVDKASSLSINSENVETDVRKVQVIGAFASAVIRSDDEKPADENNESGSGKDELRKDLLEPEASEEACSADLSSNGEEAKENKLDPDEIKEQETDEKKETQLTSVKSETEDGEEVLAMITQLVTSCIRGLHHSDSKLETLGILLKLAENTSAETILDRILPYIFHLIHDPAPRVRVQAIHTLTSCLQLVKQVPASDVNIFPEYILPGLAHLTQDESVIVRAAYAENIADIAHISLRYLQSSAATLAENNREGYADGEDSSSHDGLQPRMERELQTLHEMVQQSVSMLLTDRQNLVKQTLMVSGLDKLCRFFGKQKANDVLLSHLITFLNDKDDKELRASFFERIVDVAEFVGWHCSPILMPLLQQGLTDAEEFVTPYAINAMATLTERGLLHKSALYQLLSETVVFLVHPNLWIRHATVGFISAAARSLNIVDVQCKVQPMIQPYLKHPLMQIDKEVLLLEALVPPIPRVVLDAVVKYSDIEELFQVFDQRKVARAKAVTGIVPQYNDMCTSLRNLFRRLSSEQMTETVEDQLLIMKPHLLKISKYRNANKRVVEPVNGTIQLDPLQHKLVYHQVQLVQEYGKNETGTNAFVKKGDRRTSDNTTTFAAMNQEWRTMFAAQESSQSRAKMSEMSASSGSPSQSIQMSEMRLSPQRGLSDTTNSINDHSLHERSYIQCKSAPCRLALRQLICRKQEQYQAAVRAAHWADNVAWQTGAELLPNGWRPRGSLIAYLHEHRAAVNRLTAIPETSLFASSSADSTIKIWDVSKMEGRNIANRSRQTYVHRGGPLVGLVACERGQSLASTGSTSGSVFVVRMEPNNKLTLLQSRQLDLQEEGYAVDLQYLDSGSQTVLVYATLYGSLVGWDLRSPGSAWRLENDLKHGVITSFCVNNYQQWLTIGTSSGVHICWDLRFQLPITDIKHPSGARVRKVITHPTENSWIISAVQGNNEISMWNLETKSRQLVLWASSSPPLSRSQSGHSICAMHAGCVNQSGFLLASGTDMRLRHWNLQQPTDSYVVLPAANDSLTPQSLAYEQRLIDGTNVVQEVLADDEGEAGANAGPGIRPRVVEDGGRGPEMPRPGHHDTISSIAMSNNCILTGSADGLIQIWK